MKGKKSDPEFVSNYIIKCAEKGIESSQDISELANREIQEIDQLIQLVEKKKIIRSKLLDVVSLLDKKEKQIDNSQLSLYQINPFIGKSICLKISKNIISLADILKLKFSEEDIKFCIKQMIKNQVIFQTGNHFLQSKRFHEYLKICGDS